MEQAVIGRVAATKLQGNNSREFYFWVDPTTYINPLDLIVVREELKDEQQGLIQRDVYAQILDITSYTDAESYLEVFASTDFGNVGLKSDVERIAYHVAKAQVLRTKAEVRGNSVNIRMPVQFNSSVYLADEAAIMELLRVEELDSGYRLPIGYIEQSNGVKVPVQVDARWLTGPDGAHLNVSGKTRLAAKTSYVLFLVSSILQTQNDTAIIIFNVKGSDLLQVHEPNNLLATSDISPVGSNDGAEQKRNELKEMWDSMDLEAKPFDTDKVFYFLPAQRNDPVRINADRRNLPSDSHEIIEQPDNYFVYRYVMDNVRGRLRLLLSSQGPSDPQEQFIDALDNRDDSPAETASTFKDLSNVLAGKTSNDLGATPSTIRVVRRFIDNVTQNRTTGVFDYEREALSSNRLKLPSTFISDSLQAGQTLIVDIARVNETEQQWIFGDVLTAVERLMEGDIDRTDKPKKVVIFVDELNKYAPSGASSPLTMDLLEITARGGSLGVILFGAEQFASRIHPQVYGNCANKAFGLTDATEAGTDPYRAFPKEIKDSLSELDRGELVVSFDFFGQPLRIKFPQPACRKQEDVGS